MKTLKNTILMLLFVTGTSGLSAQESFAELDAPSAHYAELPTYSPHAKVPGDALDSISYPAELFNTALLYTLVEPSYLTRAQVAQLKEYVHFPANSSEQTRRELDFLLQLQEERTPEQIAAVMEIAKVGYWPEIDLLPSHPQYQKNRKDLFYEVHEVMGEEFTAETAPLTAELLKRVMNDMRLMEFTVKYHHLRARPYQLEPRLKPLKEIESPSFASGHTLWAYLQAFVLAELIPEKREEFLKLAYEIGLSREIMGVHYPSDEEAARQLAHEMIRLMWSNAEFQKDLRQAQLEWKDLI